MNRRVRYNYNVTIVAASSRRQKHGHTRLSHIRSSPTSDASADTNVLDLLDSFSCRAVTVQDDSSSLQHWHEIRFSMYERE